MLDTLAALAPSMVSFLSVLTLLGQLIALLLLLALVTGMFPRLTAWVSAHGLVLMFIVALTATVGSLYFSDIAGWTPCKLCWLQRICMYPQVVLLGIALWKRDRNIAPYILALCVIGIVIATGHYIEQVQAALNPPPADVPCDATGVSCASTPFFHFGYITIPMMALTAFAMNLLGCMTMKRSV